MTTTLDLVRDIDDRVREWALDDGAREHDHSPTIDLATLEQASWSLRFPQLLCLVATPENRSGTALAPAVCHAVFASLAGVRTGELELVTASGWCFRNEASETPLARQRAFRMREVVALGAPDRVRDFVAKWEERGIGIARQLGLDVKWQAATDPFFEPEGSDPRDPESMARALLGAKRELVVVGDARELALASVNLHRRSLTGAFGITRDEGPCVSACVAFGLERWAGSVAATSASAGIA